jgi:hypothetical protein
VLAVHTADKRFLCPPDPGRPLALRGFVRRDFSPKTSLLGYAASA